MIIKLYFITLTLEYICSSLDSEILYVSYEILHQIK